MGQNLDAWLNPQLELPTSAIAAGRDGSHCLYPSVTVGTKAADSMIFNARASVSLSETPVLQSILPRLEGSGALRFAVVKDLPEEALQSQLNHLIEEARQRTHPPPQACSGQAQAT